MSVAECLVAEFRQEAGITKRLLDRLPEEKLSWKPHPKSMSLGSLALHVAKAPGGIAQAALASSHEAQGFNFPEPANVEEIYWAFAESLEKVPVALGQLDDSRMQETWTLTKDGTVIMSMPREAFLRSIMLNHIYHHRGQLSVYLRMLDVPLPSIYGPSADTPVSATPPGQTDAA